jgi:hypothetical protein
MRTSDESVIVSDGECRLCSDPRVCVHHRDYPGAMAGDMSVLAGSWWAWSLGGPSPGSGTTCPNRPASAQDRWESPESQFSLND